MTADRQDLRYVVRRGRAGFVVVDRIEKKVALDGLTQQEAWLEVWNLNGQHGATPALARKQAGGQA